jgi:hypothetical protein
MSMMALKVGQAVVSVPVSIPNTGKKMQRANEVVAVRGFQCFALCIRPIFSTTALPSFDK